MPLKNFLIPSLTRKRVENPWWAFSSGNEEVNVQESEQTHPLSMQYTRFYVDHLSLLAEWSALVA
jgi:hypothetical protein